MLHKLCIITCGILLLARILLVMPREYLPFEKPFDHQPWVARLAEEADGLPVMVQNSYRLASLYQFYSGEPSWTFTDVQYRLNQYDLWTADSAFHQQPVLVLGQKSWSRPGTKAFRTQTRDMLTEHIDSFQVVKGLWLETPEALPDTLYPGGLYPLKVLASFPKLPGAERIRLDAQLPLDLFVTFHYADSMRFWKLRPPETTMLQRDEQTNLFIGQLQLPVDMAPGEVELELGLGYEGMPPLRGQSVRTKLIIGQ